MLCTFAHHAPLCYAMHPRKSWAGFTFHLTRKLRVPSKSDDVHVMLSGFPQRRQLCLMAPTTWTTEVLTSHPEAVLPRRTDPPEAHTHTTTHLAFSVVHPDHGCHRCGGECLYCLCRTGARSPLARASGSISVSGSPLSLEVRREGSEAIGEAHGVWHWDYRLLF